MRTYTTKANLLMLLGCFIATIALIMCGIAKLVLPKRGYKGK